MGMFNSARRATGVPRVTSSYRKALRNARHPVQLGIETKDSVRERQRAAAKSFLHKKSQGHLATKFEGERTQGPKINRSKKWEAKEQVEMGEIVS